MYNNPAAFQIILFNIQAGKRRSSDKFDTNADSSSVDGNVAHSAQSANVQIHRQGIENTSIPKGVLSENVGIREAVVQPETISEPEPPLAVIESSKPESPATINVQVGPMFMKSLKLID